MVLIYGIWVLELESAIGNGAKADRIELQANM